MKAFILIAAVFIITSCGQSKERKNSSSQADSMNTNIQAKPENNEAKNIELIEYKGKQFTIGYPKTWSLNQEEMKNPSSASLITANLQITGNRAITFQLVNLFDTASLETGVKNLLAKYSKDVKTNGFKKIEINNNTYINTRFELASNVYSESYFLKEGDNLFWFTFFGNAKDLDQYDREIFSITKSFIYFER